MEKVGKAEKTKQFIVEKIAPVFNKHGFAGTSLSDMTEITGLSKGSIYGNFASKDEVALAAFDYNIQSVRKVIGTEMAKEHTAKGKLMVYAHVYENFLDFPFPSGGCPMLNTAVEADDTHPALRKKAAEAINTWKNQVIKLLEEGMANGEFRKDIDKEQTALSMIATIEGGIMVSKVTGNLGILKTVTRSVRNMINELT